jgi:hypothetical protein
MRLLIASRIYTDLPKLPCTLAGLYYSLFRAIWHLIYAVAVIQASSQRAVTCLRIFCRLVFGCCVNPHYFALQISSQTISWFSRIRSQSMTKCVAIFGLILSLWRGNLKSPRPQFSMMYFACVYHVNFQRFGHRLYCTSRVLTELNGSCRTAGCMPMLTETTVS